MGGVTGSREGLNPVVLSFIGFFLSGLALWLFSAWAWPGGVGLGRNYPPRGVETRVEVCSWLPRRLGPSWFVGERSSYREGGGATIEAPSFLVSFGIRFERNVMVRRTHSILPI